MMWVNINCFDTHVSIPYHLDLVDQYNRNVGEVAVLGRRYNCDGFLELDLRIIDISDKYIGKEISSFTANTNGGVIKSIRVVKYIKFANPSNMLNQLEDFWFNDHLTTSTLQDGMAREMAREMDNEILRRVREQARVLLEASGLHNDT